MTNFVVNTDIPVDKMKLKTKQKIIQAATRYFNKHGFAAVSLHELARHLGMTRGASGKHFHRNVD